jgi:hypothetical protein
VDTIWLRSEVEAAGAVMSDAFGKAKGWNEKGKKPD